MTTSSVQEAPKLQWHFSLVLLPFIAGIYLADYRNLTDGVLLFFKFFTVGSFLLLLSKPLRQFGLLFSFMALGFWLLHSRQIAFRQQQSLQFNVETAGFFIPESIEYKTKFQKAKGVFYYKSGAQKKTIQLQLYLFATKPISLRKVYALRCQPELLANERYPGAFDQSRYYELQGCSHRAFVYTSNIRVLAGTRLPPADNSLLRIKSKLSEMFTQALSARSAAIGRALILGERDGIDTQLRTYFLATGSMHILAVSGMHIGLLILALLKILAFFSRWISRKQALLLVLLIVWYYAVLTGLSASVLRSVFMFSVLLLSQLSGRQMSQLSALFFSAFCLLLYDPRYIFDLGFQLSYLAMLGIYLYYEPIRALLHFRWKVLTHLWDGTALGLAATLTTLPLSLYHFHLYPNYAQIANLCLMSLSSLILVVGMFFPVLQLLPGLDRLSAFVLETTIQWMLHIMRFFSEAPGALAKGFVLPFWWVALFWLATYYLFYGLTRQHKYLAQLGLLGSLLFMVNLRQRKLQEQQTTFFENDRVLLLREGSKALAFGPKPAAQCAFLLPTLEIYHNCKITYKQVEKGKTRIKLKHHEVEISNEDAYQIVIRAQKQTDKIKVY
ncbi:MAG: competence protein ComEC family protein [Crocinitomicaceae bacterium]|jgi:ComEC/Rec2-related protein|nr:competence protein ComEC family protein [Crocinitomicaceae bacterium]MDP4738687.1 competence protein ComEC family protein [Crocinitomicaceae bacterium]MDP4798945.1 competence protein ComEC family protein [Crocinitomicaceae bacterium]MDP4806072.1 competence protein ComEC family protein [Crocinitomicaceae bacterium]MDP4867562.1 competence protein ComEC family protein [Crocinitomicaceae bacterium]